MCEIKPIVSAVFNTKMSPSVWGCKIVPGIFENTDYTRMYHGERWLNWKRRLENSEPGAEINFRQEWRLFPSSPSSSQFHSKSLIFIESPAETLWLRTHTDMKNILFFFRNYKLKQLMDSTMPAKVKTIYI